MTTAPSFKHQRIVRSNYSLRHRVLHGRPCVAEIDPTDMILSQRGLVQPDFFIVCDGHKITDQNNKALRNWRSRF